MEVRFVTAASRGFFFLSWQDDDPLTIAASLRKKKPSGIQGMSSHMEVRKQRPITLIKRWKEKGGTGKGQGRENILEWSSHAQMLEEITDRIHGILVYVWRAVCAKNKNR